MENNDINEMFVSAICMDALDNMDESELNKLLEILEKVK
tara:strand:- start:341 stop:457 length:117 start_codon:yes stop_codon:yes gene_type:complete